MNVVLSQLREKYGVPKPVWHYIVHLFRPRAPLPQYVQEPWVVLYGVATYENYTLYRSTIGETRFDQALFGGKWMVKLCVYCLHPVYGVSAACPLCDRALLRL